MSLGAQIREVLSRFVDHRYLLFFLTFLVVELQ
jgi:hypothetical protein